MLTHIKAIPLFLTLAAFPAVGQISATESQPARSLFDVPLLDASNTEMKHNFPREEEPSAIRGTTSVAALEHPLDGKSRENLVKAERLLKKGDAAKAIPLLEKLTTDRAAAPFAFAMLGTRYLRTGEIEAAVKALDAAVALDPSVPGYHSNLAYALAEQSRFEEALKESRKALQLDPGNSRYRLVAGQILLVLGRKEEAEFHLRKAAVDFSIARELLAKFFAQ